MHTVKGVRNYTEVVTLNSQEWSPLLRGLVIEERGKGGDFFNQLMKIVVLLHNSLYLCVCLIFYNKILKFHDKF